MLLYSVQPWVSWTEEGITKHSGVIEVSNACWDHEGTTNHLCHNTQRIQCRISHLRLSTALGGTLKNINRNRRRVLRDQRGTQQACQYLTIPFLGLCRCQLPILLQQVLQPQPTIRHVPTSSCTRVMHSSMRVGSSITWAMVVGTAKRGNTETYQSDITNQAENA